LTSAVEARSTGAICDLCGSSRPLVTVCEARDYEYGVPGTFRLVRCDACGLHVQAPRPAAAAIPGFYPPAYAVYGDDRVLGWMFTVTSWLDARRIRRLIGPTGRVLDVGCGSGAALLAMARYGTWDVRGVELDPGAAAHARARGLRVVHGGLEDARLEPGTFDLVRLGHVIEHFRDPLAALRRVHELLRPGGVLFGETPNVDCWDFRLFGRYWGALHFPRHITLFGHRSLRRALSASGFVAVRTTPRLRTVGWSAGVQNLLADRAGLRVPPNGRVWWYAALIAPFLPITALQALVSRPATLAFVARKP
jgi:SAM-dependent methyltransferase